MAAIGFDNQKYLTIQSQQIKERISQFGGKLYLEFGGKLFDDYHASRVLPGFEPDSKIRMLQQLREDVEIVIAINALLFFMWDNICDTVIPTVVIWAIIAILALIYLVTVIVDAHEYAKRDPMPKPGMGPQPAGNEDGRSQNARKEDGTDDRKDGKV